MSTKDSWIADIVSYCDRSVTGSRISSCMRLIRTRRSYILLLSTCRGRIVRRRRLEWRVRASLRVYQPMYQFHLSTRHHQQSKPILLLQFNPSPHHPRSTPRPSHLHPLPSQSQTQSHPLQNLNPPLPSNLIQSTNHHQIHSQTPPSGPKPSPSRSPPSSPPPSSRSCRRCTKKAPKYRSRRCRRG